MVLVHMLCLDPICLMPCVVASGFLTLLLLDAHLVVVACCLYELLLATIMPCLAPMLWVDIMVIAPAVWCLFSCLIDVVFSPYACLFLSTYCSCVVTRQIPLISLLTTILLLLLLPLCPLAYENSYFTSMNMSLVATMVIPLVLHMFHAEITCRR